MSEFFKGKSGYLKFLLIIEAFCFVVLLIATYFFKHPIFGIYFKTEAAFSDYSQVIQFTLSDNPYTDINLSTAYPPFIFLLMYPFVFFCKDIAGLSEVAMRGRLEWILSFTIFTVIMTALILLCLIKYAKLKGKDAVLISVIFLLSSPFLFMISRGNIMLLALLFILLFLINYKSEKRFLRELSIVFLAAAGAVKLYPMILVLLFVKEKRFADLIKSSVYFVCLLLLPFLMYGNNLSTISAFIDNLAGFAGSSRYAMNTRSSSLGHLIYFPMYYVFGVSPENTALSIIVKILSFIFLLICAGSALIIKNEKKTLFLLSGIMIMFPESSFYYSAVVFIIPFVLSWEKGGRMEKIIYAIIFLPLFFPVGVSSIIPSLAILLTCTALSFKAIKNFFNKEQKSLNTNGGDL